ncbi:MULTISPECIES: hypothetical protein [Staphylococcus]|uniref:PhiSLT protein n=1 Tax=Staphylococcus equorum TaxID=246432 RepID=A0AAW7AJQ9_9STAP|nr:hypothetical protein [Staphylococcus equorum]MDK9867038.1 hypothetical protein [Staphylococcus equorum]MDK9870000.1 hypothetical protein [Staphylococcus equorum]
MSRTKVNGVYDIKIEGVPELVKKMETKFGKKVMQEKSDNALIAASEFVKNELKYQFEEFRDTGATIQEMKRGSPETEAGKRRVMIYWEGPKERRNLIHLNEHGYTRDGKKYTPRGYGVIAKTLEAGQLKYRSIVRRELNKK